MTYFIGLLEAFDSMNRNMACLLKATCAHSDTSITGDRTSVRGVCWVQEMLLVRPSALHLSGIPYSQFLHKIATNNQLVKLPVILKTIIGN